jgi:hypothetical protein
MRGGKRRYVPIPEEQEVILRMCAAYATGTGYSAIARQLNEEGVRTVAGQPWNRKVVRDLVARGPDVMKPR